MHEGAERRITNRLKHKMKMVGHQTKREYLDGMLGFGGGEQFQKGSVVPIAVEHGGAAVAVIEDMEGMASQMAARYRGENMRKCSTMQWESSLSPFRSPFYDPPQS